jgi:hypothetical protein
MQFVVARATEKKSKYFPRHFRVLADHFGGLEWIESVGRVTPGDWAIAVRSPGYHGLGRGTAQRIGIECAFDLLDAEELAAVREKDGKILVDLGWEMLDPNDEVVGGLADTLSALEIEPSRVFIFHSNQNARAQFNRKWLAAAGTQPPYGLQYPVAIALCVAHQQKNRDDVALAARAKQAQARNDAGSRSRLFVSFNGEVRPHRLYMAAALEQAGLLPRGYFSLVYPRKGANESADQFRARSLKFFSKTSGGSELAGAASRILDRLPLELDIGAVPEGGIEELAWVSQDPAYYDDSRFTVVVDSLITDSSCLFVTEKVLKPIMNHSPFLLVGSAGGADLLRSYGFKTFEPYIRQCETGGFEDILGQAVEEIERLSRLGPAELNELSRNLADVCDYNARHFWEVLPAILKRHFDECLLTLGPANAQM